MHRGGSSKVVTVVKDARADADHSCGSAKDGCSSAVQLPVGRVQVHSSSGGVKSQVGLHRSEMSVERQNLDLCKVEGKCRLSMCKAFTHELTAAISDVALATATVDMCACSNVERSTSSNCTNKEQHTTTRSPDTV